MQGIPRLCAIVFPLVYIVLAPPAGAADPPAEPLRTLPEVLVDIDGRTVDVSALADDHNLVVVTLKAPWCPVCHEQLLRLRSRLPELEACGVTFVVLSPGPPARLREVRRRTGFDFPFVADDGLRIARRLGVAMTDELVLPCMLQVLPDRTIGWKQLGRNGAYFGDQELREFFDCTRTV